MGIDGGVEWEVVKALKLVGLWRGVKVCGGVWSGGATPRNQMGEIGKFGKYPHYWQKV